MGVVSVGMLKRYWLQVNGVCVGACMGRGARLDVYRNPYIVKEIRVIDGCKKTIYTVIIPHGVE